MVEDWKPLRSQDVCAIVVTYLPDEVLPTRIHEIRLQAGHLVIVDNSPVDQPGAALHALEAEEGVEVIRNGANKGIAAALNQGLRKAKQLGFSWALTLDQDSTPSDSMLEELLLTLNTSPFRHRTALVSPNITLGAVVSGSSYWPRPDRRFPLFFQRARCHGRDLDDVTMTITSGALTSLKVLEDIGTLREDFFIDYVDTEYCLRARSNGYRILVSAKALLYHQLGDMRETSFAGHTLRPRFHSPSRVYYLYRNRIPTIRRYGLRFPHWLFFDLLSSAFNLLRILLVEDQRKAKAKAAINGTLDGLYGRMGPRQE